ncbi:MAG TPA: DGQHR domain-containing protein [Dehalococcoidia bacterium]|nr:DGQHR domain-containing protein [Dehalococcoidia bacterium]
MTITATPTAAHTNGHKNGRDSGVKPLIAPAVRFRQKSADVNLYVTAIPLKDLLGRFDSDTYSSENPSGYQRPVTNSRLRKISHYVRDEEGLLPTSVVLCIRQPHSANFEAPDGGHAGTITISSDIPLWIVDGQHRLFGLQRAMVKDKAKWLADYELPVVIVDGIEAYEEMRTFHVINTRHKGVPTDVVDRHLETMREAEGLALIEREGERNYLRGRATTLTDILNSDPSSPWQGIIRMPGDPPRAEHMIRQHSMVTSLEPVLRDGFMKRVSDEEAAKLLLNYWNAATDIWRTAFDTPKEYVIQKPLGAGALHHIFPDVLEICRSEDDFSQARMVDTLSYVGRSAGFWHTQRGHYMVRTTGSRAVKALAEYLRERLPRPVLRRI